MNLRPQQLKVRTLMEEGAAAVDLSDMSAAEIVGGWRDRNVSGARL